MGQTQSSHPPPSTPIWQQTITLPCIPGTPTLSQSLHNPHLKSQKYTTQMINTNEEQQLSIYKERKIGSHNIVGVYDFYVEKGTFGCARNAMLYTIFTEHIPFRLENFHDSFSLDQVLYVFHEGLSGFGELAKYGKLCYANANMIGIKNNGEVKVWINQNWALNRYNKCRSQWASIEALWGCVKMFGVQGGVGSGGGIKGGSRIVQVSDGGIDEVNRRMYALRSSSYTKRQETGFQEVINMLREYYPNKIVEGRFELQRRLKNISNPHQSPLKQQFISTYPQTPKQPPQSPHQNPHIHFIPTSQTKIFPSYIQNFTPLPLPQQQQKQFIRPRAHSEQLHRKNQFKQDNRIPFLENNLIMVNKNIGKFDKVIYGYPSYQLSSESIKHFQNYGNNMGGGGLSRSKVGANGEAIEHKPKSVSMILKNSRIIGYDASNIQERRLQQPQFTQFRQPINNNFLQTPTKQTTFNIHIPNNNLKPNNNKTSSPSPSSPSPLPYNQPQSQKIKIISDMSKKPNNNNFLSSNKQPYLINTCNNDNLEKSRQMQGHIHQLNLPYLKESGSHKKVNFSYSYKNSQYAPENLGDSVNRKQKQNQQQQPHWFTAGDGTMTIKQVQSNKKLQQQKQPNISIQPHQIPIPQQPHPIPSYLELSSLKPSSHNPPIPASQDQNTKKTSSKSASHQYYYQFNGIDTDTNNNNNSQSQNQNQRQTNSFGYGVVVNKSNRSTNQYGGFSPYTGISFRMSSDLVGDGDLFNSPSKNRREQYDQKSSDSKKVAQQFKYYLRSIQHSPQKKPQQTTTQIQKWQLTPQKQSLDPSSQQPNEQLPSQQEPEPGQHRYRHIYEINTSIIPQRWQEQESLSQNM